MHKCSKDNNPNCYYCEHTEHNLHLSIQCTRIKNIWKHYQTILTKLTGQSYTPQQQLFNINMPNTNKNTAKLTITIIQIILFEIWQCCNNLKYEHKLLPQQTNDKINAQLNNILQIQYKKHKLQDTLDTFSDHFCINKALAQIQNNILRITLLSVKKLNRYKGSHT